MTSNELNDHQKHCSILDKYKRVKRAQLPRYIYCMYCSMRCMDHQDLKKHYHQFHTNRPELYTCEYCNKKQAFTDKKFLKEHMRNEPVCQHCNKRYNKLCTLQLHMKNTNHDVDKKRMVRSAGTSRSSGGIPTVPPALEAVNRSSPANLPNGYSFMSVKMDPLHKLPGSESRLVVVPETANRQGYTLKADFLNPPYPNPPTEPQAEEETEEDD